MNRASLPLVLFLSGCDGCQPGTDVPDVLDPIPADAAALWMGQGSGVGVAEVPALTVNEVGAAVPGEAVSFVSGGALTAPSATPDAFGYAWAEVTSTETPGAWDVAGTSGTFTATGTAFVTTRPDAPTAFPAWPAGGTPSFVAHAGGGVAVARGSEVWWWPGAGGAPIRVLALTDGVQGLRATELDGDGVADLAVWSDAEAVLLRGRAEGGLAFAAGWRPRSGTVRAFTTALLNEDDAVDVVLVTGDANASTLLWVESDGAGNWDTKAALDQDYAVFGATAEDLDEDGSAEVTVLTGDGLLRRFAWLGEEDGWLAATTADTTVGIADEAELFGGYDFNGDLLPEVLVAGPRLEGTGFTAVAMDGGKRGALMYDLAGNLGAEDFLGVAVADADADGNPDVFFSTSTALYRGAWNANMGQFSLDSYGGLPASAHIDATDLDGDGLVDLLLAGPSAVEALPGTSVPDDPDTEDNEAEPWKVATPFADIFDIGLTGDPWVGDFNGDGRVDVVSFVINGDPAIQAFYGQGEGAAAENLRAARATALLATDVPLDLAVCGNRVWALYTTGTGTVTRSFTIDGVGVLTAASTDTTEGATQLACGDFAEGEAAVVDDAGNVTWLAVGKSPVSEAGYGPWGDIVAADRDGDGVDELVGCPGTCTIAAGDVDGDGLADVAWSDGVDTTVSIAGLESTLGFGGAVWVGDADGDSVDDVLVQSEGVLAAWRGIGGRPGVPWASYVARDTRGRGYTGDLDGNGVPDTFWLGDERHPDDNADWTGTLLYAEAPDLPTP